MYLLARRFSRRHRTLSRDEDRAVANAWCQETCLDCKAALIALTGSAPSSDIKELYADQFSVAERIAESCPVKMGGAGDLNLLYWGAEHLAATNVIETGVAYGWSSLAILLSLEKRPNARLISTDLPYATANSESFVGCVVPENLKSRWQVLDSADRQALPWAIKELGQIDMCHYDSDKTYDGRMWAYQRLWPALRPNGFFISDDIGDNLAFRDFAHLVQQDPVIIRQESKYVGLLVKP
jgi:predicted O-methyltransferase YrrM